MQIPRYHFHLYYELKCRDQAISIAKKAQEQFNIEVGTFWTAPIGPHPVPSCQLTVPQHHYEEFLSWLDIHKENLDVFIHPDTGNDIWDHTNHLVWLNKEHKLNLQFFGL